MHALGTGFEHRISNAWPLRKLSKLRFFGLFVLLLAIFALVAFRHAGRWLVLDEPLSRKADAIFVLSGGLPYRAEEGGKGLRIGVCT